MRKQRVFRSTTKDCYISNSKRSTRRTKTCLDITGSKSTRETSARTLRHLTKELLVVEAFYEDEYHWQELPQVSFLSRKNIFVAAKANILLSRQKEKKKRRVLSQQK